MKVNNLEDTGKAGQLVKEFLRNVCFVSDLQVSTSYPSIDKIKGSIELDVQHFLLLHRTIIFPALLSD